MHSRLPPPRNHQWLQTDDGSWTLFSENFQEACHSAAGARNETLLHYLEGCQVRERFKAKGGLTILEVGFGLGLGLSVTLEELKDLPGQCHFISTEIDLELLEWLRQGGLAHLEIGPISWQESAGVKFLAAENEKLKLTVLAGDARETLPTFLKHHSLRWEAIYQDAFSPRRNPALWTTEWFSLLREYSAEDVILSTYSSSNSIRKSLLASGWQIQEGGKFGPKRSSTRATLTGQTEASILDKLQRSPVAALSDTSIDEFINQQQKKD
jgi:tRNA U34 5-methylaminomethyl-2-thiouridine-forming methyltransferase MnmC